MSAVWPMCLVSLAMGATVAGAQGPAEIIVRPQAGIGDVRLGDSGSTVTDLWGDPVRRSEAPGIVTIESWFYPGVRVTFVSYRGRSTVLALDTSAASARTSRGLRMGASVAQLRRAHPGVRCKTYRGRRTCAIGADGERQTAFAIRGRRVRAMSIGDVF